MGESGGDRIRLLKAHGACLGSRLVFLEDDLFWEFAKLDILYKGEKFFRHFLETQRAKHIILYIVLTKN